MFCARALDYAAVSYVDEQVGRVMNALVELELRSSTIVVMHAVSALPSARRNSHSLANADRTILRITATT